VAKKSLPPINFEQSIHELEALVARMERGDLPLEQALREFEHGITLTRSCQQALAEAEQRVEMLTRQANGSLTLTPLNPATVNE
jgi:exodeoxyribonuclease VII small subunit